MGGEEWGKGRGRGRAIEVLSKLSTPNHTPKEAGTLAMELHVHVHSTYYHTV